jgi:hypothetical protein
MVRLAQVGLSSDLDIERAASGGQGESTLARRNSTVMFAYGREMDAQIAADPSEPLGIVQPFGEGFGGAQVVEEPRLFIERQQGIVQVAPQINGLLQRITVLGELRQGRQGQLKTLYGFVVCRADSGLRPGRP